ncbi:MAG TPA: 2-amino-4-hydroxy-6-hydroxymethyldihydropteridine diphosphokinase [Rhodospirillaceae bacterium]|nr:2-amino-4-hydroxy-6-hydroxymethyldihydropteridine diphosphokinase [Rhodospirillaceae bacterium]
MIIIGLGANLPSRYGTPHQTLDAAIAELQAAGVGVGRRSSDWRTRPVPVSDQPWFVNAVAAVDTELPPAALLALLQRIEDGAGRQRREVNEARPLDLDLLAYGRLVRDGPEPPLLPHPRLAGRAFVLLPMAEIAAGWLHPVTGEGLAAMIGRLPADQLAEKLSGRTAPPD